MPNSDSSKSDEDKILETINNDFDMVMYLIKTLRFSARNQALYTAIYIARAAVKQALLDHKEMSA